MVAPHPSPVATPPFPPTHAAQGFTSVVMDVNPIMQGTHSSLVDLMSLGYVYRIYRPANLSSVTPDIFIGGSAGDGHATGDMHMEVIQIPNAQVGGSHRARLPAPNTPSRLLCPVGTALALQLTNRQAQCACRHALMHRRNLNMCCREHRSAHLDQGGDAGVGGSAVHGGALSILTRVDDVTSCS